VIKRTKPAGDTKNPSQRIRDRGGISLRVGRTMCSVPRGREEIRALGGDATLKLGKKSNRRSGQEKGITEQHL